MNVETLNFLFSFNILKYISFIYTILILDYFKKVQNQKLYLIKYLQVSEMKKTLVLLYGLNEDNLLWLKF